MPTGPDANSGPATDELLESVQRLNQRIEVLIEAIDQLHDELQWQNNERRGGREALSSGIVLRSMPADPTTDDWHINRVPPEQVQELRNRTIPPTDPAAPASSSAGDAMGQTPDLRQILAAFILLSSESCTADVEDTYDWLLGWAWDEFDVDVLRQSLSEYDLVEGGSAATRPLERQGQLFTEEDAPDQGAADALDEHSS